MFIFAALPTDLTTVLAALFLLFGVPAILFLLLMLYTGYVRRDAEQYLEELEAEQEQSGAENRPESIGDTDAEDATRNADTETN